MADAALLFDHGRYSNAYYLFGYGVELGLKASIARVFLAQTIPDKKLVQSIYVHDLGELLGLSGLRPALLERSKAEPEFTANWATVSGWSEESRYTMVDEFTSTAMQRAMLEPKSGVFPWLQANW